jgi:hypothetical protein
MHGFVRKSIDLDDKIGRVIYVAWVKDVTRDLQMNVEIAYHGYWSDLLTTWHLRDGTCSAEKSRTGTSTVDMHTITSHLS